MSIKVIAGGSSDISCGPGWEKNGQDLNQGAGGDYIYLCRKFSDDPNKAMRPIGVSFDYYIPGVFCTDKGWGDPRSADPSLYVDLNKGAGGAYIYLCTDTGTNSRLRDIGFTTYRSVPTEFDKPCRTSGWKPRYDGFPDTGWQLIPNVGPPAIRWGDLNEWAGGRYIYACQFRVDQGSSRAAH